MVRKPLVVLCLVAVAVLAACNGVGAYSRLDDVGSKESEACPTPPARETMVPPPGSYTNHGVHIEYDRLVPPGDPRENVDTRYSLGVAKSPVLLEQLYHDATSGNPRAAWAVCQLEVGARNIGRASARYLASFRCQAVHTCSAKFDELPMSEETASGIRLRTLIAQEFEAEGERQAIRQEIISNSLVLLAGVSAAKQVRSGAGATAGGGGGPPVRGFRNFKAFKKEMGPAGKGKEWHHIVEQTPGNVERFGPEAVHNTRNVIRLDKAIHTEISRFYSGKQWFTEDMTVRQWLSTQPFEAQFAFGIKELRKHGVILP